MSNPKHFQPPPLILENAWARMTIQGLGTGKDFKLWPGGGREWDWNETGTQHNPGIQPADIRELVEHGCKIIILSQGRLCCLRTCPETLDLLESQGIEVRVEETGRAIELYNKMVTRGEAVGGLFHSTC